ncbi:AAA family ATPase, partial [Vibrio diabolicus]|uniref:AAA family ATPase n=1 Tax=Vibrio diabolicus TaxID=50719 RepID=UPI00211AE45C
MISQINFESVASYRGKTSLNTDKKVNIIYGLNGSGKSTFSNYFYKPSDEKYHKCSHTDDGSKILVYNQDFIRDNFYTEDTINGIFSLSKENKEAKEKIEQIAKELDQKIIDSEKYRDQIQKQKDDISKAKEKAQKVVWDIKKNYSGGDRVLEFCLSGLMGKKETLFEHLASIPLASVKPKKTIDQLKEDVAAINGDKATTHSVLPKITLSELSVEDIELLNEVIVGNEDSAVAKLITELNNSDWVSDGLQYLDNIEDDTCPFCQSKTITADLIKQIRDYFDESYEESKTKISNILIKYKKIVDSFPDLETYKSTPFAADKLAEMTESHSSIHEILNSNLRKIEQKEHTPSIKVELEGFSAHLTSFNQYVEHVNQSIGAHNQRIANSSNELQKIKNEFWQIVRWEYDQTLKSFDTIESDGDAEIKKLTASKNTVDSEIVSLEEDRVKYQKQTISIEESI